MQKAHIAVVALAFLAACSQNEDSAAETSAAGTTPINGPRYTADGSAIRPTDWENWVFVGSPLTPNALNGGQAAFQEFHSVYIEPTAFEYFKETGDFANGTQLVKVRTYLYAGEDCGAPDASNGSCQAVSGRGYFNGEYSGFELTIKDTERFDDPGGWVYYNFGESPSEWADSAQPFPANACNACHETAAANDFVFTQFYPVLRASEPTVSDSRPRASVVSVTQRASATPAIIAEQEQVYVDEVADGFYVISNKADGNTVFAFTKDGSGEYVLQGEYETGGIGTGDLEIPALEKDPTHPLANGDDPLISANALAMTSDGTHILAVNPGDSTISLMRINEDYSLEVLSTAEAPDRFSS